MAVTRSDAQRVLDKGENELVDQTRHPALAGLADADLKHLTGLLRERRDRASGIANKQRRAIHGKGGSRTNFEHADAGNRQKAALLAEALSRVNKETSRRLANARRPQVEIARRALALKEGSAAASRPSPGRTAKTGMTAKANAKVDRIGSAMEAGRVSKAGKTAQAKKDSRPS
ncbi:MAG: hypothetical protein ABI377_00025 [Devosia sp.]